MTEIKGKVTREDMKASEEYKAKDHMGHFWNGTLSCPLFMALKRMGHEVKSVSLYTVRIWPDGNYKIDAKAQKIIDDRSKIQLNRESGGLDFGGMGAKILSSNPFNFTLTPIV